MKKRVVVKPTSSKSQPTYKGHEQKQMEDIFIEDPIDPNVVSISLEPDADVDDSTFHPPDYNFDETDFNIKWEENAKTQGDKFVSLFLSVLSTIDGLKTAEEFVNKVADNKLDYVNTTFLADLDTFIAAKIKLEFLDVIGFNEKDKMALFLSVTIKGGSSQQSTIEALKKYLSSQQSPTNGESPYGNTLGFSKPIG